MNEADSPHQATGLPKPLDPIERHATEAIASEVPQSASSEGWQTLDFPGAMSIDAIPHSDTEAYPVKGWHPEGWGAAVAQGVIHYSSAEISPVATDIDTIPCEPAQDHLHQLLQELERSRQTAQRQQILVETLTAQLGSSQERIAQLERDCALTQQRHNEQVQQVLQAESTSRDLRLRLHRQQQQTLQFKAALEKCLEMPTAYGNPVMPDGALAGDAATSETLAALLPKNPPVKPWSLSERTVYEPVDQPKPLFKRFDGCAAQGHDASEAIATPFGGSLPNGETVPVDPSALLDSDDPQFVTHLMQLIFPVTAEPCDGTADVLQSEPLLDCCPSLEKDVEEKDVEIDEETASVDALSSLNDSSQDTIASTIPAPLPDEHSTDRLWANLATLIEPSLQTDGANSAEAEAVDHPEASVAPAQASVASDTANLVPLEPQPLPSQPTGTAAIPPIFAAVTATPLADAAAISPSQTGWTWRDRLVSAGKVARSTDGAAPASQRLAVAAGQQAAQKPVSAAAPMDLAPTSFAVPPSPIVYPQRSLKKLASLAAVDLPTFPKR